MNTKKLGKISLFCLSFLLVFTFSVNIKIANGADINSEQPTWVDQQLDLGVPGLSENPLKGFMPYTDIYDSGVTPNFPHSMEWFYISLKDVMDGPDHFNFEKRLEPILNSIASRGHQAVFRFYLDYPDRSSGIPQFLIDGGLKVRDEIVPELGNVRVHSPNYDDPNLVSAMVNFIRSFGKKYDGDPRIGFVETGLIGFWGEWHTYPHDTEWMPSAEVQNKVQKEFDDAFNKTKLLTRYPSTYNTTLDMGFHDDSFAYETLGKDSWYFYNRLKDNNATEVWKTSPIGGELRPGIQLSIWNDPLDTKGASSDAITNNPLVDSPLDPNTVVQDFAKSVDTTHASWLNAHQLFLPAFPTSGPKFDRAMAGAKKLGYELSVSGVKVPAISYDGSLDVNIKLRNSGVAPFYYDWDMELAAVTTSNKLVKKWKTEGWKLTDVIPGQPDKLMSFTIPNLDLPKGDYKLVLRAVNPLSNGKPLQFANKKQNENIKNWLTLADFSIENSSKKVEVTSIQSDGRTLLPVRAVVEGLGGSAIWQEDHSVTLHLKEKNITFSTSDDKIKPVIQNGRTYVPIDWIKSWTEVDIESQKVVLISKASPQIEYANLKPLDDADHSIAKAPSIPGSLRLVKSTAASADISWNASTDDVMVTGYEVYRDGKKVGMASTTKYTDSGLISNKKYLYTIKAQDEAGNVSLSSNPLEFTLDSIDSYEAESSEIAGSAVRSACGTCSGGVDVGYVGNNDGTLQFNEINASIAGSYTLEIHYISGEKRSAEISVNGGAPIHFKFKTSGGWDVVASAKVAIDLRAGKNTIKIFNSSGWAPNMDRITIISGTDGISKSEQDTEKVNTIADFDIHGANMQSLLLDNYDNDPKWKSLSNDLGKWTGANSFVNDAGEIDNNALKLQYAANGWLGSSVEQDLTDYPYMVIRVKGKAGGEQNDFMLKIGDVEMKLGEWSGDTITTDYKDIIIDLAANKVNLKTPGQLQMSFWHGKSSTIWIDEIRFVGKKK